MAYQFLSWARKGIAAKIATPDDLGEGTAPPNPRERIEIKIEVSGQQITKQFLVADASDVVGIRQDMIVRTDPRPNSGDFEPNYLASIEFYDEDFPWRYTPAAPTGANRSLLRPWLMLIVLREEEFLKTTRKGSLSSIVVTDPSALPPHNELHLWAHVHSNLGDTDTPLENILGKLSEEFETDPDGLYSRILCPRKLEANVLYHAFLVPVFESGRLAGLDLPAEATPAQQPAWTDLSAELELPVYYRWQFRTAGNSDFETLLRLMEGRSELDPRIGVKQLDCSDPGYVQVGQDGPVPPTAPEILGMEGAVRQLSSDPQGLELPVDQQPFVREVKKHLDLQVPEESTEADPVVSIPFYGFHHAKTIEDPSPRFNPGSEGWLHELNQDPRNRAAAALGTQLVQKHQETIVQRAWAQLSQVQEVNRRIRHTRLVYNLSDRLLTGFFNKASGSTGKIMALAKPAAARIVEVAESKTIYQTLTESQVPNATVSSSLRRIARPGGKISKRLDNTGSFSINGVFQRLNPQFLFVIFKIDALDWFKTSGEIAVNKNIPTKLPQVKGLQSNLDFRSDFQPPPMSTSHLTTMLNTTNAVMSIGVNETVSTKKIPLDYQTKVLEGLHPARTLLPMLKAIAVGLPKPPESEEDLLPVMAHPDFPEPAYKYLSEIDQDFIIPNLKLIPPNTVALMEPNYTFIHSFMVGLNHETARELLWRKYPTDLRGSYFRQFWDAGGLRSPKEDAQAQNLYKDIKPITLWGTNTSLDNFSAIGRPFPNKPLVLLLRGELLKKYPNTIVFAQRAARKEDKLVLDDSNDSANIRFPLFSGSLAPDLRLLGFNLTLEEARGAITGNSEKDKKKNKDLGWFFVIAEVPGEPRFGMDIEYSAPPDGEKNTWDNLSRQNFDPLEPFIRRGAPPVPAGNGWPNDGDPQNQDQDLEKWARSSADMAGLLLQKPAMLAIHASELLRAFE